MKFYFYFYLLMSIVGCGVKGNPLPPLEPPQIGRGKPAFVKDSKKDELKTEKKSEWDIPEGNSDAD
jgi:predicted small lipoprotein YifL